MALPILLMGKSGSGKSSSLRNVKEPWLVININKNFFIMFFMFCFMFVP